jgi:hypothetical protein
LRALTVFDELAEFFERAMRSASLVGALEQLRADRPSFGRDLVRWLGSDDAAAAQVARRSHAHPNGFIRIILAEAPARQPALRLHLWPASDDPDDTTSDIHNHRWPYASWVVGGEFLHRTYHVVETDGEPRLHFRWFTRCDGDPPTRVDGVERAVRLRSMAQLQAGEIYESPADTLHQLHVVRPGATLIFQGPVSRDYSDIYSLDGRRLPTPAHPIGPGVLQAALRTLQLPPTAPAP